MNQQQTRHFGKTVDATHSSQFLRIQDWTCKSKNINILSETVYSLGSQKKQVEHDRMERNRVKKTKAFEIFSASVNAITQGVLIKRVSSSDKEFHFQNWFEDRLGETGESGDTILVLM